MMAATEAGGSEFLLPALSLPMKEERSRNKERLEASLAGLCELELLKQRQESRVLNALCLGDSLVSGQSPWGELRSALFSLDAPKEPTSDERRHQTAYLQCASWYLDPSMKQQVAELSVKTEDHLANAPVTLEDSHLGPGEASVAKQNKFPESDYRPRVPHSLSAPEGTEETELEKGWSSEPQKHAAVTEVLGDFRDIEVNQEDYQQAQKIETYIFGLIQRRTQQARPSKPRTSLAHDTRAAGVVRQSSLCHKDEQMPPKQVSAPETSGVAQAPEAYFPKPYNTSDQDGFQGMGPSEDPPSKCRHHQQHQAGPYPRPRQASRSTMLEYPSFRVLQAYPDSSNSEPDLPPNYHYHSPPSLMKTHQPPPTDEQLVNAKYIPAQPCRGSTRASGHQHSNPHKGFGVSKANPSTFSLERGHHHLPEQQPISQVQPPKSRGGAKKCRSNEDKGVTSRKQGKKACRSQSENSLQRVPERKYNTVERDGAGSGSGGKGNRGAQSRNKKQHQGSSSYRRWQSTLELSQDEAEQLPTQAVLQVPSASNQKDNHGRRARKSRPMHASYAPHHSHHHQHVEYQLERVAMHSCQAGEDYHHHPGQGESESSTSEADSPDSSSLSSDSDESGGLVWPQQLAPQLSLSSPPTPPGAAQQPKAFVKIKASHALKKKILRFRSGSLKVMTTV